MSLNRCFICINKYESSASFRLLSALALEIGISIIRRWKIAVFSSDLGREMKGSGAEEAKKKKIKMFFFLSGR